MAPAWDRLKNEWGKGLKVCHKMGGLLPSWNHFEDAGHSISRPLQLGPEWMHAAHLSMGMLTGYQTFDSLRAGMGPK